MLLDRKIPLVYVFKKVRTDLLFVILISTGLYFIKNQFQWLLPAIPVAIPAFLGTAISLILSFKLSQSYDRWWEARKVWGAIVNDSRSLIVQLRAFMKEGGQSRTKTAAYRQIAWCYCLGQSLRKLDPMENMADYLSVADREYIKKHTNKPLAIIDLHAQDFSGAHKEGQLELFHHVQLDQTLVRLCDAMGKAERINNTVFPTTYRLFLRVFIYVFIFVLSLPLAELNHWFEIPLLIGIALPFFLLEKSALHMQDPFRNRPTDTSVTAIARTIEINIRQLIADKEVPPPYPSNKFYIM